MEYRNIPHYDLFEIEAQARALRAEATRNAFKALGQWLRKPRFGARPEQSAV